MLHSPNSCRISSNRSLISLTTNTSTQTSPASVTISACSSRPERDRTALAGLGAVMGRYDAERQAAELALVRQRLSDSAQALEREIIARGRHYAGLGAAAGAILAVMLF